MDEKQSTLPVRIYYEDTDFSGNVYHGAYVRFFERGRTEFLREKGVSHSELGARGLSFAVHKMDMEFARPAKMDDLVEVVTMISATSGARLFLDQEIRCGDIVLVRTRVVVVMVNSKGRPVRFPGPVLHALDMQ